MAQCHNSSYHTLRSDSWYGYCRSNGQFNTGINFENRSESKLTLCVMAQSVSHWPLTVDTQVSPCGICGGQSGTGTSFLQVLWFFCHILHCGSILIYIYNLGDTQQACWWPQFRDIVSPHQHEPELTQHLTAHKKVQQSHYTPWRFLGGDRKYSSYSFLTSALEGSKWSVSHSGRALPPGKGPPCYPMDRRLGGPQSRSAHRGQRKNRLPLPGIEHRSPGHPVHIQTLYWLS
jgi:hypothetical protein